MRKIRFPALCLALLLVLSLCAGCSYRAGGGPLIRMRGEHTVIKAEDAAPGGAYDFSVRRLIFASAQEATITVKPADGAPRVEVDCAKSFVDAGLTVAIGDGKIAVSTDNGGTFTTDTFHITVYAPCKSILIEGAYKLDADASGVDDFSLEVDGAADGQVYNLDAGRVKCDIRGAAKLSLSGKAQQLDCTIDGTAALDAKALSVSDAGVTINGAGRATVNAANSLDAAINGAGSIVYYGSPASVKPRINGAGSIQPG